MKKPDPPIIEGSGSTAGGDETPAPAAPLSTWGHLSGEADSARFVLQERGHSTVSPPTSGLASRHLIAIEVPRNRTTSARQALHCLAKGGVEGMSIGM